MPKASAAFHRCSPYELLLHILNRSTAISSSSLHRIHALALTNGLWRKSVLISKLASRHARLLDSHHARKLFETMPQKSPRALNCILLAHVEAENFLSAVKLYFLSLSFAETAIPDAMTFSLLLRGFSDASGASKLVFLLHGHVIVTGCVADLHLCTDLVRIYFRFGVEDHARKVFDQMLERDLILYTAMVDGLLKNGNHLEALRVFSSMRNSGVRANSALWNAVISGFARHGYESEALLRLRQMQADGILPDQATLCIILPLLSKSAMALRSGAAVHGFAVRTNLSQDLFVTSALLDMYAKSGRLAVASHLFENSPERDTGLWNAMILAYAHHGSGDQALLLLDRMQSSGAKPNQITFTAALSACNHSGLVDEGFKIFQSMSSDHGISPSSEHLSCLVDLLGRSGRLEEALSLVSCLSDPPLEDVLRAVVAACRSHSDAVNLSPFFPYTDHWSSGKLVAMSNVYAEAGKWEDVSRMRISMRDAGLRKQTACSWIEIGGEVHSFKVFDKLHPQKNQIYDALHHLRANTCKTPEDLLDHLGL